MTKYKICVYAISKNEEQFVDRWMDAVSEADQVVVTDTGSTDRTVEKLRARGALVYEERITPWRFDVARNAALSHVPEDTDICVSNDLDEVFAPGWRQKLEETWRPEYTRAKYLFTWSFHPDGTPNKQFPMEKIHRRQDFRWVRPVHEALEYTGEGGEHSLFINGLVLHHYPDLSKPRSQYLPLLELCVKEDPDDDRAMFWLGREYMYHERYDDAVETLKRHLALPSANWDEERSASLQLIARCHALQKNPREAKAWLYRAIAECPNIREPYYLMAKLAYQEQNWPLAFAMVKNTLSILKQSGSYLVDPKSWGAAPYDYGALAAYHLGLYETAQDYARSAAALNPTDGRLSSNLALMEKKLFQTRSEGTLHEQI